MCPHAPAVTLDSMKAMVSSSRGRRPVGGRGGGNEDMTRPFPCLKDRTRRDSEPMEHIRGGAERLSQRLQRVGQMHMPVTVESSH